MVQKFYGCRPGIVVQNNDPEERGRVKVFIPDISATVYENWNNKNDDKSFTNIGKNDNNSLSEIIDKVKDILPWAECAVPIIGETGSSYYNAFKNENLFGDGLDRSSDKPAKQLEDNPPEDKFGETYKPSSYSNAAKGSFSIPRVGSHVWVFFNDGDIQYPVYFATMYSEEDWSSINQDGEDHPSELENYSKRDGGGGDDTYRNKYVISQKGGVIEIINTDNKESIKISHYNGSFKVWENDKTKEFVKGSEYKLVGENSNETVNEDKNLDVGGSFTSNIGDSFIVSSKDMTFNAEQNLNASSQNVNLNAAVSANITSPMTNISGIVAVGGMLTAGGLISSAVDVQAAGVSLVELSEFENFDLYEG